MLNHVMLNALGGLQASDIQVGKAQFQKKKHSYTWEASSMAITYV